MNFSLITLMFKYHSKLAYTKISGVSILKILYQWQTVTFPQSSIVLGMIPLFFIGILFAVQINKEFSPVNFLWRFNTRLVLMSPKNIINLQSRSYENVCQTQNRHQQMH